MGSVCDCLKKKQPTTNSVHRRKTKESDYDKTSNAFKKAGIDSVDEKASLIKAKKDQTSIAIRQTDQLLPKDNRTNMVNGKEDHLTIDIKAAIPLESRDSDYSPTSQQIKLAEKKRLNQLKKENHMKDEAEITKKLEEKKRKEQKNKEEELINQKADNAKKLKAQEERQRKEELNSLQQEMEKKEKHMKKEAEIAKNLEEKKRKEAEIAKNLEEKKRKEQQNKEEEERNQIAKNLEEKKRKEQQNKEEEERNQKANNEKKLKEESQRKEEEIKKKDCQELKPLQQEMDKKLKKTLTTVKAVSKFKSALVTPVFVVKVLEARNLICNDVGSSSDPFLKIKIIDENGEEKYLHETEVIKNSLEPKFNISHKIDAEDLNNWRMLKIEVWDKDYHKANDFMGQISWDIVSITKKKVAGWHKLVSEEKEKDIGEILVDIEYQTERRKNKRKKKRGKNANVGKKKAKAKKKKKKKHKDTCKCKKK